VSDLVNGSAYVKLIGPIGDIQETPRPTEDLIFDESLALPSSTPQTLATSKNKFVRAFHFSGRPFGNVDEKFV